MVEHEQNGPWDDAARREAVRILARRLGIGLEHDELLLRAFTHRSLADSAPGGDNERLEFLGDSVLALLVNEHLYRTFPDHAEGQLTKMKVRYVSEPPLAEAAQALDLGSYLAIAAGDEAGGGRSRPSTLSDTFEAVLAALYLSRGLDAAREFVIRNLIERVDPTVVWDYKSRLQEMLQEKRRTTPGYLTEIESGPAHDRVFRSRVFRSEVAAGEEVLGEGTGRSKKLAEQAAARDALSRLERRQPAAGRRHSSRQGAASRS